MQQNFGFPKPKRIEDPELLEVIRKLPCLACHPSSQHLPTEAHHVTTRGAGGDDVVINLMPLCTQHHQEWHLGPSKFVRKFNPVRFWLENAERWDVLERLGFRKPRARSV